MARKDFDTSHSRPHKATVPGTPPNTNVRRNRRKQVEYGAHLVVAHELRKARRANREQVAA